LLKIKYSAKKQLQTLRGCFYQYIFLLVCGLFCEVVLMVNLKGKVALVTGAARGIGREIALTLARNGADVIVTDIVDLSEVVEQIKALNVKALGVKCDVSSYEQVANASQTISETFPKVDLLVNNAGIYPYHPFANMTPQDWNKVLSINLNGTFNFCKVFLPDMVKQHYGKIVNIASIAGAFVAFPNLVHYSASKGGILGLTRSLALEVAPQGVNVNAIAPGPIDVGAMPAGSDMYNQVIKAIPVGRMGKPADIANLVAFLVSEESNFITGQCIVCDGGYILP
jgi:3-oxoacyl-[acyl-carrier protein] reductase